MDAPAGLLIAAIRFMRNNYIERSYRCSFFVLRSMRVAANFVSLVWLDPRERVVFARRRPCGLAPLFSFVILE